MSRVRVLVLRAAGINCDEEVMHGWTLAGAESELHHVLRVLERPGIVDEFDIVTIPGGFSYGDDIAAGTILGQQIAHGLAKPLRALVARGGGILGICNGFQALVKAGLLPGGDRPRVTVTYNNSDRFEARWVHLRVATDRCPFVRGMQTMELPIEHAEGRVLALDDAVARELLGAGNVVVQYVDERGEVDGYPFNPNGSVLGIAGLCDATGRVFGLMPHPDRFLHATNHPCWTQQREHPIPDGLRIFQNAVESWSRVRAATA